MLVIGQLPMINLVLKDKVTEYLNYHQRNEFAGWNINNETLEGGDLILEKMEPIRSRGYQSDDLVVDLYDPSGGFLEVENPKN